MAINLPLRWVDHNRQIVGNKSRVTTLFVLSMRFEWWIVWISRNVLPPVRLKRRLDENILFLDMSPNSFCRRMKRDFHIDFHNASDMPRNLLIFGYRYHPREQMEIYVVKIDGTLCSLWRMKMFLLNIVLRDFQFESPAFRHTTMSLSQLVRNDVSGDNIGLGNAP